MHIFVFVLFLFTLLPAVDRGNDNWLIKYEKTSLLEEEAPLNAAENEEADDWGMVSPPKTNVAAIDNGLAFPFKHPDEWRTCEFHTL